MRWRNTVVVTVTADDTLESRPYWPKIVVGMYCMANLTYNNFWPIWYSSGMLQNES